MEDICNLIDQQIAVVKAAGFEPNNIQLDTKIYEEFIKQVQYKLQHEEKQSEQNFTFSFSVNGYKGLPVSIIRLNDMYLSGSYQGYIFPIQVTVKRPE